MRTLHALIVFFAVFCCFVNCLDEGSCADDDTCPKRTENIYKEPSTDVKSFDFIGSLANIYTIFTKLAYAISEILYKYLTQFVYEIEGIIVGLGKLFKIEVPEMKTTIEKLVKKSDFLGVFSYIYNTVAEDVVKPYTDANMGEIMNTINMLKLFMK